VRRLLALLLLAPTTVLALEGVAYQGEAREPKSGALLYEEHHYLRLNQEAPVERLVLYRCPNGEAFARKTVRYGRPSHAPQFRMDDARFGYIEGFEIQPGGADAFFQRSRDAAMQREAVAVDDALVVDAGFDEFVRSRWEQLQAGESVPVRFLVPSRLAAYDFKLRKVGEEPLYGEPASVFRLALSGMLGWFADAIDVSYRDSDRRLMRFVGLSNIRATPDKNLVAKIEFPPQREQRGLSDAEWAAASSEPLRECRVGE